MTSAWTWLIVNGDLGSERRQHRRDRAGPRRQRVRLPPGRLPVAAARLAGPGPLRGRRHRVRAAPRPGGRRRAVAARDKPAERPPDLGHRLHAGRPPTAAPTTPTTAGSGLLASAVVTANAPGGITSGPSARVVAPVIAQPNGTPSLEDATLWVGWTGIAPSNTVYTASSVAAETGASTVNGSGDAYTSGYGSSAVGAGSGHVSGGSGASPPTSGTGIGDTVTQRLERVPRVRRRHLPGPVRRHDAEPGGGGARRGRPAVRRERQQPRPERQRLAVRKFTRQSLYIARKHISLAIRSFGI